MTLVKLLITLIGGLSFISVVEACAPLEFRCGDGQCVPASWKCDGERDCTDGSDETADECAASRTCNPLHFTCGNSRCIPKTWMCDGTDDCGDNTDESSCPSGPPTCDVAQFQCGSECVPMAWVCDGEVDCVNRHDEANCSNPTPSSACRDSEFRCRNGDCINVLWACDGDSDCRDHSDEMNCTLPTTCQPYEFSCVNSNADGTRCIPINLKCDGLRQCEDGSDEVGCSAVNCSLTEFRCAFNKRLMCISVEKVCDRSRDCPGGDDEVWTPGGLCNQSTPHLCDRDNGGCSQLCNRRPVGPLCLCRTGYQLDAADNSTCTDVDECASPELCSHICRNTPGSYTCTCHRGYEMDPSQSYCKVSGMSPRIILANRHNIRQYNLNGREYTTLINRSRSAIAIDYDYSRSNFFYSDVAIETIYLVDIQFDFQVGRSSELVVNLRNVDGVAYDWVHRNLYWTDTGTDTISVLSNYTGTRYRKVLIREQLDEPRAIVVDPREDQRWMYWSDWGSVSKIEKAGLDGSNRKSIVTQNIQWPNGITIDFISNRIFWVDAKLKEIGSCDLNGNNYKLVAYSNQYLAHPFSIDVFEDFVYWTDWETNSILKANKFSGKKIDTVLNGLSAPMGLKIYHEVKQPNAANACGTNNGRCSHICLPLPNSNDSHSEMLNHTCTCPDIVPMGEKCYLEPLIPTESSSTTQAGMEVTTSNIAEDTSAVTKVTSSATTLVHTTIVSSDETTTNSGTTGKSLEITTGSDVIGTTSVGDFVPGHKNTRSSKLIIIIVMVLLALVLVAALVAVYVWYRFYYLKNSSKGLTYMFDNPHYIPDNESKELLVDISPGFNSV